MPPQTTLDQDGCVQRFTDAATVYSIWTTLHVCSSWKKDWFSVAPPEVDHIIWNIFLCVFPHRWYFCDLFYINEIDLIWDKIHWDTVFCHRTAIAVNCNCSLLSHSWPLTNEMFVRNRYIVKSSLHQSLISSTVIEANTISDEKDL